MLRGNVIFAGSNLQNIVFLGNFKGQKVALNEENWLIKNQSIILAKTSKF